MTAFDPSQFGISSSSLRLVAEVAIAFLAVIWLGLVLWTYTDARRRIADPTLIACATIAALFPFVGWLVYRIVRPPERLDQARGRELETHAIEAQLLKLGHHRCAHCGHRVQKEFLRCPSCTRTLKRPCPVCGRALNPAWRICPYCEAEPHATGPALRQARRRPTRTAGSEREAARPSGR